MSSMMRSISMRDQYIEGTFVCPKDTGQTNRRTAGRRRPPIGYLHPSNRKSGARWGPRPPTVPIFLANLSHVLWVSTEQLDLTGRRNHAPPASPLGCRSLLRHLCSRLFTCTRAGECPRANAEIRCEPRLRVLHRARFAQAPARRS